MKGGGEHDALTGWRKVMNRPYGGWKRYKKSYNRRLRRILKQRDTGESINEYDTGPTTEFQE